MGTKPSDTILGTHQHKWIQRLRKSASELGIHTSIKHLHNPPIYPDLVEHPTKRRRTEPKPKFAEGNRVKKSFATPDGRGKRMMGGEINAHKGYLRVGIGIDNERKHVYSVEWDDDEISDHQQDTLRRE